VALACGLLLGGCDAGSGQAGGGEAGSGLGATAAATSPDAPVIQPGAPGEPNTTLTGAAVAPRPSGPLDTDDVRFMQDMIVHHAQAIAMVDLAREHLTDTQVRALAERIADEQGPEISSMASWLRQRGQDVPPQADNPLFGANAHSGHAGHTMAICERLGEPKKLAKEYMAQSWIASANEKRSPKSMLKAFFYAAGLGTVNTLYAIFAVGVGYIVISAFYITAVSIALGGVAALVIGISTLFTGGALLWLSIVVSIALVCIGILFFIGIMYFSTKAR
jgi:hypothetical protein